MKTFFLIVVFFVCLISPVETSAQWVQTNGLTDQFIMAVTTKDNNLYVGTIHSGVHASSNQGTNWFPLSSGWTNTYVNALAFKGGNLFAGIHLGGVLLSTNNGGSWATMNNGLTDTIVKALVVSGENVFAGTSGGGVFLSTDNGNTWNPASSGLTTTVIHSFTVTGTHIFAGTYGGGTFSSSNNGAVWTAVNTGMEHLPILALATQGTSLFAGTTIGAFRSTDNGEHWTYLDSLPYAINCLAVVGTNLFAGSVDGLYLSTDNGFQWTDKSSGLTNRYVNSLGVHSNSLFAGTWGNGIWRRPLSEMVTSVERSSTGVPAEFNLYQNYPNPFNPATTVSFGLPQRSFVSLKVFDAVGREVSTLVSEELPAGTYAQQWNAALVSSGVYFYRLQAGDFTATKKLVLLR